MLKVRVIAVLTFNGIALVKTKNFSNPRMLGNPTQVAKVFNLRNIDELVFVDINASKQGRKINIPLIQRVIKECYMPVAIGGGVGSIEDIQALLKCGADKVIIKSQAIKNPKFITEAASFFGSQCISIAVDVVQRDGQYILFHEGDESIDALDFLQEMEKRGAGELIVNSVDADGTMNGFDIELYKSISNKSNLPIVAVGGGGEMDHYSELFRETSIEAVGSSSIFAYTRYTPNDIKKALQEDGIPVRLFEKN
jgi:cyclase